MERLPLFPLNTVLFPGMPIYLHIFEDRYKLMIGRCIEQRQPFGVVLIKSGSEVQGFGAQAEPYKVGCSAQITQVQPLGDGRMNIEAVGYERFQIEEVYPNDEPYLTGDVTPMPLITSNPIQLQSEGINLKGTVERYLNAIELAENVTTEKVSLPDDPTALMYLAASALRVSAADKQALLAENDALRLISTLRSLYRREVTLLEIMSMSVAVTPAAGPFSSN